MQKLIQLKPITEQNRIHKLWNLFTLVQREYGGPDDGHDMQF